MQKKYTIALLSVFLLHLNVAFAEEKVSENKVIEIIAKIEKAKEENNQTKANKAKPCIQETAPIKTEKKTQKVVEVKQEKAKAQKKNSNELHIVIPKVPEVPQAIKLSTDLLDASGHVNYDAVEKLSPSRKKPIFTNRVAPERFRKNKQSENKQKDEILLGNVKNARVTAYLHAPLISVDEVETKLKELDFDILAKFNIEKKGKVVSLVYTNDALKQAAAKDIRGFAATLRIVVDQKNKLVSISNPVYLLKAFMQKEYDAKIAEDILKKIHTVFPTLKASTEVVKFLALERYRFMANMPYYQDMQVVQKGKNADLLAKAKKSKKVVYEQTLSNGSIVLGVKLGKRTSKFVKKIGYENSGLLPYPILIEKGEAKILDPQYYIAVMYPMLKMSKFMTIATVPGAIAKDIDKIFR